jgi:hypothetical protein
MKRLSSKLTYANVISTLCLFLLVGGGTAFAASHLGKNSVGSKQLKKNAVTTAKLKNGAVTGSKLKLSTLGTVPSATTAANAGHATTADSATNAKHAGTADTANHASSADTATNAVDATNATNFSRYFTSGLKKASVGQTVTIGTAGPFTFVGKCVDSGGGNFSAEAYVTTSVANSFFWADYGSEYEEGDFEPGEEAELPYEGGPSSTTPDWYAFNGFYSDFNAASPDGSTVIQGYSNEGVHVFGSDCAFNVTWTSNA